VYHGAPLRLLVPVKLGLKNVKGHYENHVYRGKTEGFLGRARIFLLRRDLVDCTNHL
jgi:DMSO/TMAO reductase YedYZ molybdopterin-dependent catalytic subunit